VIDKFMSSWSLGSNAGVQNQDEPQLSTTIEDFTIIKEFTVSFRGPFIGFMVRSGGSERLQEVPVSV
jgi:hypothetical protein